MAKAIRFSKRDLEIIQNALAVYESDMEDNQTDEEGNHTNHLFSYHAENYGDPDVTLDLVRRKVYFKIQRFGKSA